MRTVLAILVSGCLCLLVLCVCRLHAAETVLFSSSTAGARALVFSDRRIVLADNSFVRADGTIVHVRAGTVDIPCFDHAHVVAEKFLLEKPSVDKRLPWKRTPVSLRICDLPVPNALVPGSLQLSRGAQGHSGGLLSPSEYNADSRWGTIAAAETNFRDREDVYLSYLVRQRRIVTVAVDEKGKAVVCLGPASVGYPAPPKLQDNLTAIFNVLCQSGESRVKSEDVHPVESLLEIQTPLAMELLAGAKSAGKVSSASRGGDWSGSSSLRHTIAKLESGKEVTIAFVGDSVTAGFGASTAANAFPELFCSRLKERFPASRISHTSFAASGAISKSQFERFLNSQCRPDLVVVEFVNDVRLSKEDLEPVYARFFAQARARGCDVIVCLPHLVSPTVFRAGDRDWKAMAHRPYYTVIRGLAEAQNVAVADVVKRFEEANLEGLTPQLLLVEGLLHPNDRGHEIYAEELLRQFPPN